MNLKSQENVHNFKIKCFNKCCANLKIIMLKNEKSMNNAATDKIVRCRKNKWFDAPVLW